jgi:hypothetical protein
MDSRLRTAMGRRSDIRVPTSRPHAQAVPVTYDETDSHDLDNQKEQQEHDSEHIRGRDPLGQCIPESPWAADQVVHHRRLLASPGQAVCRRSTVVGSLGSLLDAEQHLALHHDVRNL